MPNDQNPYAQLPPEETSSWLSTNRKFVILGAIAVLAGVGLVAIVLSRRTTSGPADAGSTTTANANGSSSTARSTFQRSWAVNAANPTVPSYRLPTNDDLKSAITQLQNQSGSKQ